MEEVITSYLYRFNSPYVGNIDMVGGHSIYNSLLSNNPDMVADTVLKVSHGIFHDIQIGIRSPYYNSPFGESKYDLMVFSSNFKINKDKIIYYSGFLMSRDPNNPFGEGNKRRGNFEEKVVNPSTSIIRKYNIKKEFDNVDCSLPDVISFFTITKNEINVPEKLVIGGKRNYGFGEIELCDTVSFFVDDIIFPNVFDDRLRDTARNGIRGIGKYKKYGYGEFRIFPNKNRFLVELITPYCTDDGTFPSFLKNDMYRPKTDHIWDKGQELKISSIDSGQQFELRCF
jgi:hypothetical protein